LIFTSPLAEKSLFIFWGRVGVPTAVLYIEYIVKWKKDMKKWNNKEGNNQREIGQTGPPFCPSWTSSCSLHVAKGFEKFDPTRTNTSPKQCPVLIICVPMYVTLSQIGIVFFR
jgi:hypothetical protein